MSVGTRPLGWLYNYFSRKPQGQPYELLQSVQPTIDVSQDWPLPLTAYVNAIAASAGNTQVDVTLSDQKHRLWVLGSWSSPQLTVYQPAVLGSMSVTLILAGAPFPPVLFYMRLNNANGMNIPDQVQMFGTMAGQKDYNSNEAAVANITQKGGNIYQPPGSTLRFLWTQQTAADTINLRGLYIEKDATSPLYWPF